MPKPKPTEPKPRDVNADWTKGTWDVTKPDGTPVQTLDEYAQVLGMSRRAAAFKVLSLPSGQAAPKALRQEAVDEQEAALKEIGLDGSVDLERREAPGAADEREQLGSPAPTPPGSPAPTPLPDTAPGQPNQPPAQETKARPQPGDGDGADPESPAEDATDDGGPGVQTKGQTPLYVTAPDGLTPRCTVCRQPEHLAADCPYVDAFTAPPGAEPGDGEDGDGPDPESPAEDATEAPAPAPAGDGDGPDAENAAEDAVETKGFPAEQTCKFCDQQATQRLVWADGRAYIPACDDCEDQARQVIEVDNADEVVRVLPVETKGIRLDSADVDALLAGLDVQD